MSEPIPGWRQIKLTLATFTQTTGGKRCAEHLQPLWKQSELEALKAGILDMAVFHETNTLSFVFKGDLEPLLPRIQHLSDPWERSELEQLRTALIQARLLKQALAPFKKKCPHLFSQFSGLIQQTELEAKLEMLLANKERVFGPAQVRPILKGRFGLFKTLSPLLIKYDLYQARVRFAQSISAVWPEMNAGQLSLSQMTPPQMGGQGVAWNFEWPRGKKLALVSGAHGSGKTLFMQSLALAVYMHQAGLALPAKQVSLPFFQQVCVKFSPQSFVSELEQIRLWLNQSHTDTLVILDDLALATNPGEAYALSRALLDKLVDAGAWVVCSTHQTLLQRSAELTFSWFNLGLVRKGKKKKPQFELLLNQPERSQTLETAQQAGWPQTVIAKARAHYQALTPAAGKKTPAQNPRPISTPSAKKPFSLKPQRQLTPTNIQALRVGQWVYVSPLGLYGELASIPRPPKYDAEVISEGIRLTVPAQNLVLSSKRKEKKGDTSGVRLVMNSAPVSDRCDLHEYRVYEALPILEKFLDSAYQQGLNPVYIIHGKGQGKLKRAVHDYLKDAYYVKTYRLGQPGEGDSGVTVVDLA